MPGTATAAHTESGADSHRAVVATLEIQERGGDGAQAAPDLVLTRAGAQIEGLKRPYTDKQLRDALQGEGTGSVDGRQISWFWLNHNKSVCFAEFEKTHEVLLRPHRRPCRLMSAPPLLTRPHVSPSMHGPERHDMDTSSPGGHRQRLLFAIHLVSVESKQTATD